MRIAIVTDTTCDLPQEALLEYGIHAVPAKVILDGKIRYDDGSDLNRETFYSTYVADKSIEGVTTEPPSAEELLQVYKHLCLNYDAVLSIHVSDKHSETVKNARVAAQRAMEVCKPLRVQKNMLAPFQVRVIDSKNISIGLGMLVMRAAELVQHEPSVSGLANALERLAESVYAFAVFDDLSYMKARRRGAKVSWLQVGLASALDIKPIIQCHRGEMKTMEQQRGYDYTVEQMFKAVVKRLHDQKSYERVGIVYGGQLSTLNAMPQVKAFREELAGMGVGSVTSIIGPSLGFYGGPRCLAVGFINDDIRIAEIAKR